MNNNTPKKAFLKLVLNEIRLGRRHPVNLVLGLGLPIGLLVIFGLIPALNEPSKPLGGLSYFQISFPILVAMTVLSLSFVVLPTKLAQYREQGILRRLSTTPIPPWWLLAAQVIVNLAIIIAGLAILNFVGIRRFHLHAPQEFGYYLVGIFLTITAFFAIGLCISALAKSSTVASAIGGILFYPMLLFSGIWIPREIMPQALKTLSDWSPMGAAVGSIQNSIQGSPIDIRLLLILVGYTIILGFFAVRYFKWE